MATTAIFELSALQAERNLFLYMALASALAEQVVHAPRCIARMDLLKG